MFIVVEYFLKSNLWSYSTFKGDKVECRFSTVLFACIRDNDARIVIEYLSTYTQKA